MHTALKQVSQHMQQHPFSAPRALRNGHLMTLYASLKPRRWRIGRLPVEHREFEIDSSVRVVAYCHWQNNRIEHPTVIIVHGLEGSADARYVIGTAEKIWDRGLNVIRYNVRSCGGTERLSSTLYHSGLTSDLRALVTRLRERDGLNSLFLVGFSMGGNQVLKLAGELGMDGPSLIRGVCAISPAIDLEASSVAIARRENWLYQANFVRSLKTSLRRKAAIFPQLYDVEVLRRVRTLRNFDDFVTAPSFGFRDALDYYTRSSARPLIPLIRIPTLIIHAQDDPFIPCGPLTDPSISANQSIVLVLPEYGGHVAFYGNHQPDEDHYWAENRAAAFCSFTF
jgi:predicted alpha/beta-fold hydrolase